MNTILEPAKQIPVIEEADICVLGGSCTGVFAAVRAARLGAKVVIVEKQNCFGGTATSGMVNVWHSLYDTEHRKQIIAGLTKEVIDRLKSRDAVIDHEDNPERNKDVANIFNSEELKIELDCLIREEKITPYLHTSYCAPIADGRRIEAILVENKSGRGAIRAKMFIDATGDGDLCRHLGLTGAVEKNLQPPTACAKIYGINLLEGFPLQQALSEHGKEFGLPDDWGWNTQVPGAPHVTMHAETHVFGVNCADANMLTYSEMEGRRTIRAMMDIIRKYAPNGNQAALVGLCSIIGIRETYHAKTNYQITDDDILYGKAFDDAIGYGSYRVDIHHSNSPGLTFRYLDGTQVVLHGRNDKELGRWREETQTNPTYYQIPYRALVPRGIENLIACGRMIDAQKAAYSALRVMVNTNQTGEAAGVAAVLALQGSCRIDQVEPAALRRTLKQGGSVVLDDIL